MSTTRVEDTVIKSCSPWLSHTSEFKFATLRATLPGAWQCGVHARADWPGVNILW